MTYIRSAAIIPSDESEEVRVQFARDINTSSRVLASLVDDPSAEVRLWLSLNPNSPTYKDFLEPHNSSEYWLLEFSESYADDYEWDEWMYHVFGGPGNFDRYAVLIDFDDLTMSANDADWWQGLTAIIDRLDFKVPDISSFLTVNSFAIPDLTESQLTQLYNLFVSDPERYYWIRGKFQLYFDALPIVYPDISWKQLEIRSPHNPDKRAICIYNSDKMQISADELRDWYYWDVNEVLLYYIGPDDLQSALDDIEAGADLAEGKLWEWFTEGSDCYDNSLVTRTQYLKMEATGDLLSATAKFMGVPADRSILI